MIFAPFITAIIYLIAKGDGMAKRHNEAVREVREAQDAYIRDVTAGGTSPAEPIAHAKQLLDSGAITQPEYEALKAKALA